MKQCITSLFCIYLVNTDVPDIPVGPLNITSVSDNTAEITWKPPKCDGGLPLKWYVVEQCDLQTKNWHQVNAVLPTQHNLKIDDLMSGKEYLFRVVAENDKGRSKALEIAEPFSIQVSSGRILIY